MKFQIVLIVLGVACGVREKDMSLAIVMSCNKREDTLVAFALRKEQEPRSFCFLVFLNSSLNFCKAIQQFI